MSTLSDQIIHPLRGAIPALQAIYRFGSAGTEHFTEKSDVDIAVLSDTPLDPMLRWKLTQRLAQVLNRDVDLVDLANATTVVRFQVVSTGERIFAADTSAAEWWELKVYQLYLTLNDDRRPILEAIQQSGRVYGE